MGDIEEAFAKISRSNFVPEALVNQADIDAPLPIECGQTISQPTTVEMMLGWLEVEPGNKVLDVGSGSGWTTALLSYLVGPRGKVYAVELIPELVDFGRDNCARVGVTNAEFYLAGKTYGLPKFAPYDRILVSAAAQEIPKDLLGQLASGGKMVMPVKADVLEIEKSQDGKIETITHPGFAFVPLI